MKNWRYNNETGFYYPVSKTEHLTVVFNDDWNDYGFQLTEAPQYVSGGGVSVVQYITGGATWIENPVSATPPAAGHFMVDYDAPGYEGTGRIRFNSADNGKTFTVSYLGLGRIIPSTSLSLYPFLAGFFPRSEVFTSSDTFSVPDGVTKIYVIAIGGGGGGAYSLLGVTTGASGGGGGVSEKLISVSRGDQYTVTVGTGGSGGLHAGPVAATAGTSSSFGSVLTASGGGAGTPATIGNPGRGGDGSGGDLNYSLGDGGQGISSGIRGGGPGGMGGNAAAGHSGKLFGGGGGGTMSTIASLNGGAGAPGVVIVFY